MIQPASLRPKQMLQGAGCRVVAGRTASSFRHLSHSSHWIHASCVKFSDGRACTARTRVTTLAGVRAPCGPRPAPAAASLICPDAGYSSCGAATSQMDPRLLTYMSPCLLLSPPCWVAPAMASPIDGRPNTCHLCRRRFPRTLRLACWAVYDGHNVGGWSASGAARAGGPPGWRFSYPVDLQSL